MAMVLSDPGIPGTLPRGVEDEGLFEIIDGRKVELPPMSAYASVVATILSGELYIFAAAHPLGRPCAEMLFRLPRNGSRNRRPDVAFVTFERWPQDRSLPLRDNAWDVVPDVAVEVISPTDLVDELMQKSSNTSRRASGWSGWCIRRSASCTSTRHPPGCACSRRRTNWTAARCCRVFGCRWPSCFRGRRRRPDAGIVQPPQLTR